MLPWDRRADSTNRAELLRDVFTEPQLAMLTAFRARVVKYQAREEHGLDERRLEFASWLVAHGRLCEEIEGGERSS